MVNSIYNICLIILFNKKERYQDNKVGSTLHSTLNCYVAIFDFLK